MVKTTTLAVERAGVKMLLLVKLLEVGATVTMPVPLLVAGMMALLVAAAGKRPTKALDQGTSPPAGGTMALRSLLWKYPNWRWRTKSMWVFSTDATIFEEVLDMYV